MEPESFYQELQPELSSGERILWTGQPSRKSVFGSQDWFMVPFSFLWGGFAIFWEAGVLGMFGFEGKRPVHPVSWFMALWGVPFVLIGQYLIWGRFLYVAWKKKKIIYAVTDKRILVVNLAPRRRVVAAYLQQLPAIEKSLRANGIGTLTFGLTPMVAGWGRSTNNFSWDGGLSASIPIFIDVEDADSVYRIVSDARENCLKNR
jgi:hypothetical protein